MALENLEAREVLSGDLVWADVLGGGSYGLQRSSAIDGAGNVYAVGSFSKTTDFDPGPGVTELTDRGNSDVYLAKFAATGGLIWVKQFGGMGRDDAYDVALDSAGNIAVLGGFEGTADFDPGAVTASLTSQRQTDLFVAKFDSEGDYLWAKQFGAREGTGKSVSFDAAGNVVLVGGFSETCDFDPGTGTANLTSQGNTDVFVAKLDSTGNYLWAQRFGGLDIDVATSAAIDAAGGIILAGWFWDTVDFDPGPGTANLTSAGGHDAFLTKLDAAGNFVWVKQFGGTGEDFAHGMTIDAVGNILLTGKFRGGPDFDPGPGTAILGSPNSEDIFVLKLNSAGNFIWVKGIGGAGDDSGESLATDAAGNIWITGRFGDVTDFDPGAGTASLTSADILDAFVLKLDASGNYLWAKQLGGSAYRTSESGFNVVVDAAGNVAVSGVFTGAADFDPGAGTLKLDSGAYQAGFLWHLNAVGSLNWAFAPFRYGTAEARATTIDSAGNVIVVGSFGGTVDFHPKGNTLQLTSAGGRDAYVAKYAASGTLLWAKGLGGNRDDFGYGAAVDVAGNIVLTGSFQGTADFDPNAGTANLVSSGGSDDVFIAKLDAAGNFLWAKRIGGTSEDIATGAAIDSLGNVSVTGYFWGTVDFDPGVGTVNLISAGGQDAFLVNLSSGGNFQWAKQLGGTAHDLAWGVAADAVGNVAVVGQFRNTVDFDPSAGFDYLTSAGGNDVFVSKFNSAGVYLNTRRLGGADEDVGYAAAFDAAGNLVVTGEFRGTADFNPGVGIANLTSVAWSDAFIVKLDALSNYVWAKAVGGESDDAGWGVAADAVGNVYFTGSFSVAADFDPGPGLASFIGRGDRDTFITKLNAGGSFVWADAIGGPAADCGYAVTADHLGNLYVAGMFIGEIDFDPGAGAFNINGPLVSGYLWKLAGNEAPLTAVNAGLVLSEGRTAKITAAHLQIADVDGTPASLMYTLGEAPHNGKLTRNGVKLLAGQSFTQADVDAGIMAYVHDGGETTSDSFTFTGSDSFGGMIAQTSFAITVSPDNDAPAIDFNGAAAEFTEGDAAVAVAPNLLVQDDDDSMLVAATVTINNPLDDDAETLTVDTSDTNIVAVYDGGELALSGLDTVENYRRVLRTIGYRNTKTNLHPANRILGFAADDGAGFGDVVLTAVKIVPLNDRPVLNDDAFYLYNKSKAGTVVGVVRATDFDLDQALTYSIADGNNGAFAIDSALGVITVVNPKKLIGTSVVLTVRATDNGAPMLFDDALITIYLRSADTPVVFSLNDAAGTPSLTYRGKSLLSLDEYAPTSATHNGQLIGTLAVVDPDDPDASPAVTMTDPMSPFKFDAVTGRITVIDAARLNYEKSRTMNLTFTTLGPVLNGTTRGKTSTFTVSIFLNDCNETPVITSPAILSIAENNRSGAAVGAVKATDPDTALRQRLVYNLDSQRNDAGNHVQIFAVDPTRGTISVASSLDYEMCRTYTLVVRASDNGTPLVAEQTITVTIIDLNEAPVLTLLDAAQLPVAALVIPENPTSHSVIGYVKYSNPDIYRTESLKFELKESLRGMVRLGSYDADTGLVPILTTVVANWDFETIPGGSFTFSVTVIESGFTNNVGEMKKGFKVKTTIPVRVTDISE